MVKTSPSWRWRTIPLTAPCHVALSFHCNQLSGLRRMRHLKRSPMNRLRLPKRLVLKCKHLNNANKKHETIKIYSKGLSNMAEFLLAEPTQTTPQNTLWLPIFYSTIRQMLSTTYPSHSQNLLKSTKLSTTSWQKHLPIQPTGTKNLRSLHQTSPSLSFPQKIKTNQHSQNLPPQLPITLKTNQITTPSNRSFSSFKKASNFGRECYIIIREWGVNFLTSPCCVKLIVFYVVIMEQSLIRIF